MTRDDLLANIKRDRARLDEVIARVPAGRLTEGTLDDGWSVKDALAHVTAWEQLCMKWIREGRRDEGPFDDASINAFNRRLYEERREIPLADVLATSKRSTGEMVEMVEGLSEDVLAAEPAWNAVPLWQVVRWNADEHYREHIEQIGHWLDAKT